MDRILTPQQMKNAESASAELGVSLWDLMNNAGEALADCVYTLASSDSAEPVRAAVLCGSGNNGGDGFVCARQLEENGLTVTVYLLGEPKTDLAKRAFTLCEGMDIRRETDDEVYKADFIIDCVFGTGFHGELSTELKELFGRIQDSGAKLIACDCPSGVNCMTGQAAVGTLRCAHTVTFHAAKLGMCLKPARAFCGEVTVRSIGIPAGWEERLADPTRITEPLAYDLHRALPLRPEHSHKGTFGRLLMVCGCESYIGAAAIASRAALRSGCGITELAAPKEVIRTIAGTAPECVYTPLPCDEDGFITADALPILLARAKNCTAAVIGCGLGQTEGTAAVVEGLVKNLEIPLIIDADGINQLAKNIDVLRDKNCEVLLTPHIGELARLCGVTAAQASADRYALGLELSAKYGVTVHAKDSTTLTFSEGSCRVSNFGCSALAKGGSGDMLAGLTGSMAAQGVPLETACRLGSYIMGRTAELLCEGSSPAAVTATDIIAELRHSLMVL